MHSHTPEIVALHHEYRALTGMDIGLDFCRERQWADWMRKGWTRDDLSLVVNHLKKGIREGKRNMGALKFHNLIGQIDFFEEDLSVARAEQRKPYVPNNDRQSVLKATGRVNPPAGKPARTAADVLRGEQAFLDLKKLRESL